MAFQRGSDPDGGGAFQVNAFQITQLPVESTFPSRPPGVSGETILVPLSRERALRLRRRLDREKDERAQAEQEAAMAEEARAARLAELRERFDRHVPYVF